MIHDVKSSGFGNLQLLMTAALHWGFPSASVLVSCAALRQTAAASTESLEAAVLRFGAPLTRAAGCSNGGGWGGTGCQRWCEIPLGSHPPTWRPAAAASAAASRIPPTPPDQTGRQEVKPVTFLSISQLNLTNPSGLWNHVSTSLCEHWAATLSGIRDCLTEKLCNMKRNLKDTCMIWCNVAHLEALKTNSGLSARHPHWDMFYFSFKYIHSCEFRVKIRRRKHQNRVQSKKKKKITYIKNNVDAS